jgi:hypothetical protein
VDFQIPRDNLRGVDKIGNYFIFNGLGRAKARDTKSLA